MDNKNKGNEVNFVHKETIHKESVRKERKFEIKNFKKEYTFSPHTCIIYFINSLSFHRKTNQNNTLCALHFKRINK